MSKNPILVLVEWEDSFHPSICKWIGTDEVNEFIKNSSYKCKTVGWLLHKDKRMVSLAAQRDAEMLTFAHIQRIPVGCIIKIKELK